MLIIVAAYIYSYSEKEEHMKGSEKLPQSGLS